MRHLIVALGLCASAFAQQILVVNATGGTPYTDIQSAIDAAAPGDRVEVRPGAYAGFSCGKGLRIQGQPGVVVEAAPAAAAITLVGVPGTEPLSLSQLELRAAPGSAVEPRVELQACSGLVLLHDLGPPAGALPPRLLATQCAGVTVADSGLGPLRLVDSLVHLTNCAVTSASLDQGALVSLVRSHAELTDGFVQVRLSQGGAGFRLQGSTLRLRVVRGLTIDTVPFPTPSVAFDIGPDSRVDYHALANPTNPTVLGGPFYRHGDMTSVRVRAAGPGGTVAIDLVDARRQGAVLLFLSAPVAAYTVPGITGDVFVGGGQAASLGVYAMTPGLVTTSFGVPSNMLFRGRPLVVQGLQSDLRVTNASGFTLR